MHADTHTHIHTYIHTYIHTPFHSVNLSSIETRQQTHTKTPKENKQQQTVNSCENNERDRWWTYRYNNRPIDHKK